MPERKPLQRNRAIHKLSPEALQGVIEEFISRNGTDYGEVEASADFINGGNMIASDGNLLARQFPGVAFPDGSGSGLYPSAESSTKTAFDVDNGREVCRMAPKNGFFMR